MNNDEFLRFVSLALDELSEDAEIREIQILQLQKIIDYQIILQEVTYDTAFRRTEEKNERSS